MSKKRKRKKEQLDNTNIRMSRDKKEVMGFSSVATEIFFGGLSTANGRVCPLFKYLALTSLKTFLRRQNGHFN